MDEHEMLRRLMIPLAFTSFVSSIASISLMLRNQATIRARDYVAVIGSSITASCVVFLLLNHYLEGEPYILYGVSILAGAGGASTFDLLFFLARKWARKRGFVSGERFFDRPGEDGQTGDPDGDQG